jgi:hypothetical protein
MRGVKADLSQREKALLILMDLVRMKVGFGNNLSISTPEHVLKNITEQKDHNIYRIHIVGPVVSVLCLGMERVDSCLQGEYSSLDELPQWVQERIAILSMLTATPPTEEVHGVGRRISEHTYWVYRPDSC